MVTLSTVGPTKLVLPPGNAKRAGRGLSAEILSVINTLSLKKLNNAQKITSKY